MELFIDIYGLYEESPIAFLVGTMAFAGGLSYIIYELYPKMPRLLHHMYTAVFPQLPASLHSAHKMVVDL